MPKNEKIKPLADLTPVVTAWREQGKTVVHTHGTFELLHAGVVRHLEAARSEGDVLIVSVSPDARSAPDVPRVLFNQALRAEALAALQCVDLVGLSPVAPAAAALQTLRPDVYVSWDEEKQPEERAQARDSEAKAMAALGGRYCSSRSGFRAPALTYQRARALSAESEAFLTSFCARYSFDDVVAWLNKIRSLKVLFIGETIIDEYQYCESIGKSGKEPVLAARYVSAEKFAGGILATANQAAAVCDQVGLVSLLGSEDSHEEFIRAKLDPKIAATFVPMPGACTILKRRLVEVYPFQKLFEIYFMDPVVPESATRALHEQLPDLIARYDAVVVTDYGHGMLTPEIIECLCAKARFLAVNTQTNAANQGFNTVSKYRRADYVCLSERELRLEARNHNRDARLLMADTAEQLHCQRMVITQGSRGCTCYEAGVGFTQIPSFTNHIVDRIGAGDALLAITSLCAAQGLPLDLLGFLGNAIGAQAVETVGNRSVVSRDGVLSQVESLLSFDHGLGRH